MRFFLCIIFSISLAFSYQADEFDSEFDDAKTVFDPLSGYNRAITHVNDFVYESIFDPVIFGYKCVMPEQGRIAVANIFDNLMFPVRFVNNLLQLKFKNATDETLRFIANTIVGFAGVSDVATKHYNIKRHDEDFGQTLGHWGLGNGFHIVWPILGPSNFRDTIGMVGDYFATPISYVKPSLLSVGIKTYEKTNTMSLNPSYTEIKKDAIDVYIFLRDAYEQRRDYLIKE